MLQKKLTKNETLYQNVLFIRTFYALMSFSFQVNPVRMMDKLTDVKREYSALVQEAAAIQELQKVNLVKFVLFMKIAPI